MIAKSKSGGHEIVWDNKFGVWIYADTKEIASEEKGRKCRYCNKFPLTLHIPIPADLSHTGKLRWDWKPIDFCIGNIIQGLNVRGVYTRSSCCGHGVDGEIMLHDGRTLIVKRIKK